MELLTALDKSAEEYTSHTIERKTGGLSLRRPSLAVSHVSLGGGLSRSPESTHSALFRLYPLSDPRSDNTACPPGDPRLLLLAAARANALELMGRLIEMGAPLDAAQEGGGGTALHAAARHTRLAGAQILLEAEGDPNGRDAEGLTPLHIACGLGDFDPVQPDRKRMVELLLQHGASVDAPAGPGVAGATPVHVAAATCAPNVVALLTRALPSAPKLLDGEGRLPLHHALGSPLANSRPGIETVQTLLKGGSPVAPPDPANGATPLQFAAGIFPESEYQHAIIGALLRANAPRGISPTPLGMAVKADRIETVTYLLQMGFSANAADNDGTTPLHHAATLCSQPLVRILLASGANVNASTKSFPSSFRVSLVSLPTELWEQVPGVTPLHIVASREDVDLFTAMVEAGGNLKLRTGGGNTAADLVIESRQIQALILSHMSLLPPWSSRFLPFPEFLASLPATPPKGSMKRLQASSELYAFIENALPLPPVGVLAQDVIPQVLALIERGASINAVSPDSPTLLFHLLHSLPSRSSLTPEKMLSLTVLFFALVFQAPPDAIPAFPLCDEQLGASNEPRTLDPGSYLDSVRNSWGPALPGDHPSTLVDLRQVTATSLSQRNTLLHVAAGLDLAAVVALLLLLGCDPSAPNSDGLTPFDVALSSSSSFAAQVLLSFYPQLAPSWVSNASRSHLGRTLRWTGGSSLLVRALLGGDQQTLRVFRSLGRDVHQICVANAMLAHDAETLGALLSAIEIDPNFVFPPMDGLPLPLGTTPALLACYLADADLLSTLLSAGSSSSLGDRGGRTPLHVLIVQASKAASQSLRILFTHDPSTPPPVNARDAHGLTPLMYILDRDLWPLAGASDGLNASGGMVNAQTLNPSLLLSRVEGLLTSGADPNMCSSSGESPLGRALFGGGTGILTGLQAQVAELLLRAGASVDSENSDGETMLLSFCRLGHTGAAHWLLAHDTDVVAMDKHGRTALHLVAAHPPASDMAMSILPKILEAGRSDREFVNAQDHMGRTALHFAVLAGAAVSINRLTEAGAVAVKDRDGKSPYDLVLGDGGRGDGGGGGEGSGGVGGEGGGGGGTSNPKMGLASILASHANGQGGHLGGEHDGATDVAHGERRRLFDKIKGMVTLVVATLQTAGFALALDLEWHSSTRTPRAVLAATVFKGVVDSLDFLLLFWLVTGLVGMFLAAFFWVSFRRHRAGAVLTWLFADILFVPTLRVFISVFRCSSGRLAAAPSTHCFTPSHTYTCLAAVGVLVLYLPITFRLVRIDHQPEAISSALSFRWTSDILLLKRHRLHRMTKRVSTRAADLLLHAIKVLLVSVTVVFYDRVAVLVLVYIGLAMVYGGALLVWPTYVNYRVNAVQFALAASTLGISCAAGVAYLVSDDESYVPLGSLVLALLVVPIAAFVGHIILFASRRDQERIDFNQALQSVINTRQTLTILHNEGPTPVLQPTLTARHDLNLTQHHYAPHLAGNT